ncbi:MAG TPA: hypothetical protein VIY48_07665, partial [Candidatus Paceibacterota bacterium]
YVNNPDDVTKFIKWATEEKGMDVPTANAAWLKYSKGEAVEMDPLVREYFFGPEPPKPLINWDVNGIGNVVIQQEVSTRGFTRVLTPDEVLALSSKMPEGQARFEEIAKYMKEGGPVAPPFLDVKWDKENKVWRVVGHEGRNRSIAAKMVDPNAQMEVHFFPKGMTAKDVKPRMLTAPILPQGESDLTKAIKIPKRTLPEQPIDPKLIERWGPTGNAFLMRSEEEMTKLYKPVTKDTPNLFETLLETLKGKAKEAGTATEETLTKAIQQAFETWKERREFVGFPTSVSPAERASFDEWFKGSKMVDANGEPQAFYHGTTRSFEGPLTPPGQFAQKVNLAKDKITFTNVAGKEETITLKEAVARLRKFEDAQDAANFSAAYGKGKELSTAEVNQLRDEYWSLAKEMRVKYGYVTHQTDSGMYAKGIYLSPYETHAAGYAGGEGGNMRKVYVNLKNPYEMGPSGYGIVNGKRYTNIAERTKAIKDLGYDGVIVRGEDDKIVEIVVFDKNGTKNAIGIPPKYNPLASPENLKRY